VNASFLIADPTAICRQKLQKKGIGVVPTQARATAFQLRWDERLLMKVTSERIRNIIPAAIARLVIHVQTSSASFSTSSRSSGVMSTGLMFFSTSFGLTFFSLLGLLPVHSQNTPIVDLKCPLSTFPRFSRDGISAMAAEEADHAEALRRIQEAEHRRLLLLPLFGMLSLRTDIIQVKPERAL
jgi:hypothetical protein